MAKKNWTRNTICFALIIMIVCSGICSFTVRADSFFGRDRISPSTSTLQVSDVSFSNPDMITGELIGNRKSGDLFATDRLKEKNYGGGYLLAYSLLAVQPSFSFTTKDKNSRVQDQFCGVSRRIIQYIQKQDGEKD